MQERTTRSEQIEARLCAHVLAHGLGHTSLRQLARAAGTSDRMLLYYYADKAEIIGRVLTRLANDMGAQFDAALPADARLAPAELLRRIGALAASPAMRAYMDLWAEIAAEAARGTSVFPVIAAGIAEHFRTWAEGRLAIDDPQRRTATASLLIVAIDGAALLAPVGDGRIAGDGVALLEQLLG